MSFMVPEVYTGQYWMVETLDGTSFLPTDCVTSNGRDVGDIIHSPGVLLRLFGDYVESKALQSAELCNGTIGRLSAPGYMDCTDWGPYDDEETAEIELREELGEDDASIDDDDDTDEDN